MVNGIIVLSENEKISVFDYNKCFNETPSQNIEIFIDESDFTQDQLKFLYDNTFRINSKEVITYDSSNNIYSVNCSHELVDASIAFANLLTFSLDTYNDIDKCQGEFSMNISFPNQTHNSINLYFLDQNQSKYKTYSKVANDIYSNIQSFMLLRTNPKLTGNIKLVIDTDYNLYLDTFKVSTTSLLNDKKYRHQAISSDGNYPYDVYNVFNSVPSGEMYSVYDDSYDPHKNYYDPYLQVENIYEYGAEFNDDKLYSENMRILAPLHIGKRLPDYFIIFKTDRLISNSALLDNTTIFKDMLSNGSCIKIFDLRNSTPIGKYLHNYKESIESYFSGACSLQFIEQDTSKGSPNYRQGRNAWRGISYDKGILTDKVETSYFANNILSNSSRTQELFNMFLLNGYSRNNLLYANILNLQFMFNDEESLDMSMHNYFGLYLTENDFLSFNQIIQEYDKSGNAILQYYDEANNTININDTTLKIVNNSNYVDRIFFATTYNNAVMIKSMKDFNSFALNSGANKPYTNILNVKALEKKFEDDQKSFMTLSFSEQIRYGEHFKFICLNNKASNDYKGNIVLDIIASNDSQLVSMKDNINPYVSTNTDDRFIDDEDSSTNIYRLCFYTQDLDDATIQADLPTQLYRLKKCIEKFDSFISISSSNDTTIGLMSKLERTYYQHILADHIDEDKYDNVDVFNLSNKQKCQIIRNYPDEYILNNMPFMNAGFETIKDRYSIIQKFASVNSIKSNYIYEIPKNLYKELNFSNVQYLLYTSKGYYPIGSFTLSKGDISYNGNHIKSTQLIHSDYYMKTIISPFDVNKFMLCSKFQIVNNVANICEPIKVNVALMGINSIKDIDMYADNIETINRSSYSSETFNRDEIVSIGDERLKKYYTYKLVSGGIYNIPIKKDDKFTITNKEIYYTLFNSSTGTYDVNVAQHNNYIQFNSNSVVELVNAYRDDYNYNVSSGVMLSDNFYVDPNNTSTSKLDIPLVPLVNCQWESNGEYFDTISTLDVNNLYNYSLSGNFIENVYVPSTENPAYVSNKMTDTISFDSSILTMRDFILNSKYGNSIKKFLINNYKLKTAICSYNPHVQSLDFIYYGIKFNIKLSNAQYSNDIHLNDFSNYEVLILNDYDISKNNEIFVSKIEEFILIVNHEYKSFSNYGNEYIKIFDNDISNANYNWFKSIFNYELINMSNIQNKLYISKSANYTLADSSNYAYNVELDYKKYDSFDEDDVYFYIDMKKCIFDDKYSVFSSNNSSFNFIMNDTSLSCYQSKLSNLQAVFDRYYDANIDMRDKQSYIVMHNDSSIATLSYNDKIQKYIESFNNDLDLYVINDESYQTYNINSTYKPITMSLSVPNQIKYNQGMFIPKYNDIFKFTLNDNISSDIDLDTLYGNSNIESIEDIKNMLYNKIMNVNKKCTFNYFMQNTISPITTDWDTNFYRLYDDDSTFSYVPGYNLGIVDKMFFGSKCLVMHDSYFNIEEWNYTGNNNYSMFAISNNNVNAAAVSTLEIVLNISDAFVNQLLSNDTFISNWNNIGSSNNKTSYINNYINNTLYKIFDINNPIIELYSLYDSAINNTTSTYVYFKKSMPDDLEQYSLVDNASIVVKNINGKIYAQISIQDYTNKYFYPIVKINKI